MAGAVGLGVTRGGAASGPGGRASRTVREEVSVGNPDACSGVTFEFYENDTVGDSQGAGRVFDHLVGDVLGVFASAGTIAGFRAVHYRDDVAHRDRYRRGRFGVSDVEVALTRAGWTDPESLSLAFVDEARVWDGEGAEFRRRTVRGGAAGHGCYFSPGTTAVTWKAAHRPDADDDRDHVRWAAHGAAMELLHALVEEERIAVTEHELGSLIEEYNAYYGRHGRYGSPLASGADTWDSGPCRAADDPTVADRDGVTFTMSPCTRAAVANSVAHHCR